MPFPKKHNRPKPKLNPTQVRILHVLLNRDPKEGLQTREIAEKANIGLATLYRYLKNPDFIEAYRSSVLSIANLFRAPMMRALIEGGLRPGPGQNALQRTFWELLGELNQKGISGGDIEHNPLDVNLNVDFLPGYVQKLLVLVSQGGELPLGLVGELENTLDDALNIKGQTIEIVPEYRVKEEKQLQLKAREEEQEQIEDEEEERILRELMEEMEREERDRDSNGGKEIISEKLAEQVSRNVKLVPDRGLGGKKKRKDNK